LVKVSEDDSVLQPTSSPLDVKKDDGRSPVASEAASQQDAMSEPVGSPLGPASPGMQFAEQTFNQSAAVTVGYSGNHDSAEQLLLKLESLQTAEGLSAGGTQGQKARIAEEAFAEALQCLEQGNVAAAVNLLKVAQAACPTNKPQAQARIILLLGRCQQMTGPAKPETAPPATAQRQAQSPNLCQAPFTWNMLRSRDMPRSHPLKMWSAQMMTTSKKLTSCFRVVWKL